MQIGQKTRLRGIGDGGVSTLSTPAIPIIPAGTAPPCTAAQASDASYTNTPDGNLRYKLNADGTFTGCDPNAVAPSGSASMMTYYQATDGTFISVMNDGTWYRNSSGPFGGSPPSPANQSVFGSVGSFFSNLFSGSSTSSASSGQLISGVSNNTLVIGAGAAVLLMILMSGGGGGRRRR